MGGIGSGSGDLETALRAPRCGAHSDLFQIMPTSAGGVKGWGGESYDSDSHLLRGMPGSAGVIKGWGSVPNDPDPDLFQGMPVAAGATRGGGWGDEALCHDIESTRSAVDAPLQMDEGSACFLLAERRSGGLGVGQLWWWRWLIVATIIKNCVIGFLMGFTGVDLDVVLEVAVSWLILGSESALSWWISHSESGKVAMVAMVLVVMVADFYDGGVVMVEDDDDGVYAVPRETVVAEVRRRVVARAW